MAQESVRLLAPVEFPKFIADTNSKLIVVDFFADWCFPCKMMAPIIEELAGKFHGKVKFGKIDVDNANKLSIQYKVSSIPCIVFLKNGKEVGRSIGSVSKDVLEKRIQDVL